MLECPRWRGRLPIGDILSTGTVACPHCQAEDPVGVPAAQAVRTGS